MVAADSKAPTVHIRVRMTTPPLRRTLRMLARSTASGCSALTINDVSFSGWFLQLAHLDLAEEHLGDRIVVLQRDVPLRSAACTGLGVVGCLLAVDQDADALAPRDD